ncbi:MAG: hypothetical protein V1899_07400, partial [Planctomycetota bacterium]
MKLCVVIIMFVATTVVGFASDVSCPNWEITICLDTEQEKFVLHEPVPLKVIWKNITKSDQMLERIKPKLAIAQAGVWSDIKLYETLLEQSEEVVFAPDKVKSQESFQRSYWLLLGAPAGSTSQRFPGSISWKFLFDAEGEWQVALPSDKTVFVKFIVSKPREADRKAFDLFSQEEAKVLLYEIISPVSVLNNLITIVKEYPDSVYAPYATLALAMRERRLSSDDRTLNDKMEEWLKKAIQMHPRDWLGENAMNLLISVA